MSHDHDHSPEVHDASAQAMAEALKSSFAIVKVAMVMLVAVFFASGFFTVGSSEKAVILRFGKPVGEGQSALLTAGLHWSFPYPIDEVVKIPFSDYRTVTSSVGMFFMTREQEVAFRNLGTEPPIGPTLNPAVDGYVISADRNILHVSATLSYQVKDPIRYIFEFENASNSIQNALNNALVYTAAKFNVDDILTRDRIGFQDAVQQRVTELADRAQFGISIDSGTVSNGVSSAVQVESVAPLQLKDVFTQVTTARENRNKLLNDAHSYENKILSEAGAQASAITNVAASDRARYVESLTAEAKRFAALRPNYEKNPNLFAQQQLVEVVGQVLTNVQDKIFLPQRADGKPRELRLQLNREPPQPKTAANP